MRNSESNHSQGNNILNIADKITELAHSQPGRKALVFTHSRDSAGRAAYTHLTFQQLEDLCHIYAHGLRRAGINQGAKTLLMVRPGIEFTALTFALFKIGAIPILIDPGMGIISFVRCVRQVEPEAMIGIPAAHLLRRILKPWFSKIKIPISLGHGPLSGGIPIRKIHAKGRGKGAFPTTPTKADDMAAILFTTGSTGPAKGVVYTHRIFDTQVEILKDVYKINNQDTDLPCFPLFSLFSTALGACAVIPDIDPSKPATVDPRKIIEAIDNHSITCSFGSPALWRRVATYCRDQDIRFRSLKKVIMAGAPIPANLHDLLLNHVLEPDAMTHSAYGATESLPVADFTGDKVLAETWDKTKEGAGVCVGHPLECLEIRIIKISDDPISLWNDDLIEPPGKIGEITIKGPIVTPAYYSLPEHTKAAKIYDKDGTIRHRMGDLGYLDEQGRLWVCGRKNHRVITADGPKFTLCCEALFNQHPAVCRSALTGIPDKKNKAEKPIIVIEPEPNMYPKDRRAEEKLKQELLSIGEKSSITRDIKTILIKRAFPVDIRHNAKIKREQIKKWALNKTE